MSYNLDTQLPRVVDGQTTFSAADMNPIIEAVEDALSNIKDYVDQTGYCGYVAELSGFSSTCNKGTIIALGGEDGTIYVPAEARWSEVVDGGGSLIPAKESIIVGVLLADPDNNGKAPVLCAGWLDDPAIIAAMVGSEASAGLYYLTSEGKAAASPSNTGVVVPCFTYLAAGAGSRGKLIFNPSAPEFQSHSHDLFRLQGAWEQINPADLPEQLISQTAASRLRISDNNQDISELLKRGHNKLTLYRNGIVVPNDDWCIADNYIYVAFSVTSTDKFDIAAVVPNTGITPYIDSVTSNAKILDVYSLGGDVFIDFKPKAISNQNFTASAVTELSGDGVKTAPVVHQIYPGVGITVEAHYNDGTAVPGCYDIHNEALFSSQIDLNITNLNGVLLSNDEELVCYTFPAGVTSSLFGSARIPRSAGSVKCRLNVMAKGTGSALPDMTSIVKIQTMPSINEPASVTSSLAHTVVGQSNTSIDKVYLLYCDNIGRVSGDAIVAVKLRSDNPDTAIQVLAVSLELYT